MTHLAGSDTRRNLLHALRRLSAGPVLMSYWRVSARGTEQRGRAANAGDRIGQIIVPFARGNQVAAVRAFTFYDVRITQWADGWSSDREDGFGSTGQ